MKIMGGCGSKTRAVESAIDAALPSEAASAGTPPTARGDLAPTPNTDALPREVLMRVHEYAAPTLRSLPDYGRVKMWLEAFDANGSGRSAIPPWLEQEMMEWPHNGTESYGRNLRERIRAHHATRLAFSVVAELRSVCKQWRDALDDPLALIWFWTASAMGLEPPLVLYSGGTYRDVCRLLLETERQKRRAEDQVAQERPLRIACGMRMMPREHEAHPNPQKPAVVLPPELVRRVAENAKALETFLHSFDFTLAMKEGEDGKDWHESALLRYQMFLHLKKNHPSVWLIPTADIEFCWLAHIFRTRAYWKDVSELGIQPEHKLCLSYGEVATFSQAVQATEDLWNDTFGPGFPYLPPGTDKSWQAWIANRWRNALNDPLAFRKDPRGFFPTMGPLIQVHPPLALHNIHLTAAEVKADLQWYPELQEAFDTMSRDSDSVLRGYRGGDTLLKLLSQQVLPSYERFLNLCNQSNAEFSPPLVLDLVWHAHQMEPHRYKEDCLSLFDREFWHEPWPLGLGVHSSLTEEFECAWMQAFGTPIADDWKFHLGSRFM